MKRLLIIHRVFKKHLTVRTYTVVRARNYFCSVSSQNTRKRDAKSTDKTELKAFIGLFYLAGLHRSNRQNLEDLWASDGTGIELFRLTMSLRKFNSQQYEV